MSEVKKFSLLGAVKAAQSQEKKNEETPNAVVDKPVNAVTTVAAKTPVVLETPAPRKSLLHGGYLAPKNPGATGPTGKQAAKSDSGGRLVVSGDSANQIAKPSPAKGALLAGVQKAKENQEKAQADMAYIFNEMPVDFKELLDRFDTLLKRDTGINDFNIDMIRAYVKRIMMDLREHPEYDGLVIDRDVRNVIAFIRSTKEKAIEAASEKKEKSEKKKANAGKSKNRFGDVGGFIDFGPTGPGGIAELAASEDWSMK